MRRKRWFFARITGRRRIGKTTLVQRALKLTGTASVFHVQVPDSAPAGVLSAFADAMETFDIDPATFPRPTTLLQMAQTVGALARAGYVVALDEFLRDNVLRSWLHALNQQVQATSFRPRSRLIETTDERLAEAEGFGLERRVATPSMRRLAEFALGRASGRIKDTTNTNEHIEGFLKVHGMYRGWTIERVAIAPAIDAAAREQLQGDGFIPQDLVEPTRGL